MTSDTTSEDTPSDGRARQPVPAAVIERLKTVVGPAGHLEAEADTEPYRRSWRYGYTGRTPLVVRPQSTAEVAAVVGICSSAGVGIVPQGGNTGLTYAGQPHDDSSEIVLSTERLGRIRDLDTANDTITVEAGVVLQEVQERARAAQRLFPLSLGAQGSCRIGGNISTNAGGVQVLRYGTMRNLVLGLEVVLADGRIWDGLRALRKDNTGYDLKHLFIGGEGTLGVITAATLALFPLPSARETAWIGVDSPAAGVALLTAMKQRLGLQISAFELICRQIVDILIATVPGHQSPMRDAHPWYVLMDVTGQGTPGSLHEPLGEALAAAMEAGLVRDAVVAGSEAQAARLWRMREDMAIAQVRAGGTISHDISVPVSKVPELIARADAALERAYPGIRHCAFGHVGDGNIHYNPIRPLDWTSERYMAEFAGVNAIVHDIVLSLGGSISAEHGIGRMRREENYRTKSAVEIEMMRAVKQALDPGNIMNPGKMLRRSPP